MSNRPLILISNDDGFRAKGINDLADFVSDIGDIVIVAPDGSRSGTSMSITGHIPVELKKISEQPGRAVYSLTGTPVDCVKMACECVLDRRPDIVLGGINHGDNSSVNTLYSGTMGLVMEACLKGIPAVGFSSCYCASDAPFGALRRYIIRVVRYVIENGLPPYTCRAAALRAHGAWRLAARMAAPGASTWVGLLLADGQLQQFRAGKYRHRHACLGRGLRMHHPRPCGYDRFRPDTRAKAT